MGRMDGKVALVTGAARGQGRSHAVGFADEGADVIVTDLGAGSEELEETVAQVESRGRRAVSFTVDIRDRAEMKRAIDQGAAELGRLDAVVANAAFVSQQPWDEVTPEIWKTTMDVNVTGTWHTCELTIPHLIAAGGGALILISSGAGIKGYPFLVPYSTSKHAVVGLMHSLTNELAEYMIRVNTVHPTGVDTPMNAATGHLGDLMKSKPELAAIFKNALPVDKVESSDITNAVLYLASDEARYVTGLQMKVDAGVTAR